MVNVISDERMEEIRSEYELETPYTVSVNVSGWMAKVGRDRQDLLVAYDILTAKVNRLENPEVVPVEEPVSDVPPEQSPLEGI